ncbi:Tex family protein [candidate division KSB1 bacterium]
MDNKHILKIAEELSLKPWQVEAVAKLLDDGSTVPFIARYRKELTGSLDEIAIRAIRDRLTQLEELDKRREAILKSLEERELLTDELEEKILAAETMSELEDIYLPYRPKKRTRATIAKEKGLEPLAEIIFEQDDATDPVKESESYIDPEKEVETVEDALAGARDIIAEWVNENQEAREKMRMLFAERGIIRTKAVKDKMEEGAKYKDYFEWEEPVFSAPSHRILAMRRGENEGFLHLGITPPEDDAIEILERMFVKAENLSSEQVREAVHDSYKRLLSLSMETEARLESKKRADEEAIKVFVKNLRQLLLASPLGEKRILAIDPGFRTGCKVVCLDSQGKLLDNGTIFPHNKGVELDEAIAKIKNLCEKYEIEAIAIGNGTAGRETEAFINGIDLPADTIVVMVNESGASIYSASEVAREEFPDYDVTVRGAVSIGRRLMDPLAELVKIDPKSIGVGQYQHDVDQSALKQSLGDTVISSVNAVGVEVNTASKELLTYVSGLGPVLAKNIVEHRNKNGPFSNRKELKKVTRLGEKAFEQAAGFLRIRNAENPLDSSAVHPESYFVVDKMAKDLNCSLKDLMKDHSLRKKVTLQNYVTDTIGIPTLRDIIDELAKPGRDPRKKFELFKFSEEVNKPEDLKIGMKLPGIVTNITNFGVFVDIGVHQDGLVHISQMSDKFVKNPADVVKLQQSVMVTVIGLDLARKRIQLSMKTKPPLPG